MGSHFFGNAFGNLGNAFTHPFSPSAGLKTVGIGVNTKPNGAVTAAPAYAGVPASVAGANAGYGGNNLPFAKAAPIAPITPQLPVAGAAQQPKVAFGGRSAFQEF